MCQGRKWSGEVSLRIKILGHTAYYLHAIHDGANIVGYCSLEYREGYHEKEHSFHQKDMKSMEKYSKPFQEIMYEIKQLKKTIRQSNLPADKKKQFEAIVCEISTEEEEPEYFNAQFEKAGVEFCKRFGEGDHIYVKDCENLDKFFASKINPF